MVSYCAGCNGTIHDRYLMKVLEKTWHSECLVCGECGAALAEKCFTKDGKFYCKTDFYKKHGVLCTGCRQHISHADLIRRTSAGGVYHVYCFTCTVCSRQLGTGEEFYTLPDNKFLCKNDFNRNTSAPDNEVHSTTNDPGDWKTPPSPHQLSPASHLSPNAVVSTTVHESPNSDSTSKQDTPEDSEASPDVIKNEIMSDNEEVNVTNSPDTSSSQVSTTTGKRRGPRTTIKSKQLEILKEAFTSTPKPTRHIREQLATRTGLNMRVIQVWFQNRRSKERRMKQMNLANRGRYGNPLSRDHPDEYGYVQDHFYHGECYLDNHPHNMEPGFMQCLQVPGMDPHSRPLGHDTEPWRGHYSTLGPHHHNQNVLSPGYSTPITASSWSGMIPDSTNQIAFQT